MDAAEGGITACDPDAMPEQDSAIAEDGNPVAEASSAAEAPPAAAVEASSSHSVGSSSVRSMLQRERRHASLPVCPRKENPTVRARRLWQQLVERMEAEWALIALSERLARRATPTSLAAAAAVAEAADHAAERRAALTDLALKVHAHVLASEFTAEAVAQQAANLNFQQVEQMQLLQSMLDSMQNFALADWVRLNVYNTMNTSVAVPVGLGSGRTPESWRRIDFDQLVYGVGPDASPEQKLHKGSVVFLIQQAEAKAASAGAGQAAGSAAGGAAGTASAMEAAGQQPAQVPERARPEAVAAGSASGRSRPLRWDLSNGSPEQGGAGKKPKKRSHAGAAVLNGRCHGRRPASGAKGAAAPKSKAGPKRWQALNSAVRQRADAAATATGSDAAAPPEQTGDPCAAADAASPETAAAAADPAAADALQASAQGISGGSAAPAPPAGTDPQGAEPASEAESPRETLEATLPDSGLQGQALDAGAGPGWLRGIFAFQRREAERAEPEKPPEWDRFVDRERSWTGLSAGGSLTAQAAAAGLGSGRLSPVPGSRRASPQRWHFWKMPEHLVNPGAKRSRPAQRQENGTGVSQAAQPQMQPSCGGTQLPSTGPSLPAAGQDQQKPSQLQHGRPSSGQEAESLAGSGREQLPDRSLPALKPGPKLHAVYPMLDSIMLFNPGGPYSEKSARHAALRAALTAQMAAEAERLQTQKSAGASFLPELQAMHQAPPLQSSSRSVSVRNTLRAVMRKSMVSRSGSPLGFDPPASHRAASPLGFELQASQSIPCLADAPAMQDANGPPDQPAASATVSSSSPGKTPWAAGPAPLPQASPRRTAIAMHHRKMMAAQAASAEASKEADVQQQQSGAAPAALQGAAGSMAMTGGRASSSWPSARSAQRQVLLAVAGEQADQAPEGGESAERAEERRRLRHVEMTPEELAASGDFQRRLGSTYRATLIRQYHGVGHSDATAR